MVRQGNMSAECYTFNDGFYYKNGVLFCENINLADFIKSKCHLHDLALSTPCFVYSRRQLMQNITIYKEALPNEHWIINYAMKANMNPKILQMIKEQGMSLTLVSGNELELALKLGFQTDTLVMNGNGKLDWEIKLAVKYNVLLNVDSAFNMKQTIRICKEIGKGARILLRVNPNIRLDVHRYVSTGEKGSKFGLCPSELQEVLSLSENTDVIEIVGLHCHLGSTITDTQVFRESTQLLMNLIQMLKERGFRSIKYVNIGGGLAIPYRNHAFCTQTFTQFGDDIKSSIQKYLDDISSPHNKTKIMELLKMKISIQDLIHQIKELPETQNILESLYKIQKREMGSVPSPHDLVQSIADLIPDDLTVIIEPGRSLVGNSAVLLCSVLGTKSSGDKNFIVIDGSMTEVIRPCLYGAYHHIDLAEPCAHTDEKEIYDIVGPVCESADFLGKDRLLSIPTGGSIVAVFDVGAYCSSMTSNYNMRVRPAEVLIDGDDMILMRKPDTFEDILNPYRI